jgi:hypothetical protein
MAKQNFQFFIDRKITIWAREIHKIEADSYEEAKGEMIKLFRQNECEETLVEQEILYDTQEDMSPSENGNQPTAELYGTDLSDALINNI